MRSTRKIIRYEIKDDVEETVPTDEMKIKVENLDELKDMEQNKSDVIETDIQNVDEINNENQTYEENLKKTSIKINKAREMIMF